MKKEWYIVSYDIRDPTRLRKVSCILKGYGNRLQYSVFRCRLTDRDMERLRWEVTSVMFPQDSLLILRICSNCLKSMRKKGENLDWEEDPPNFEII